MFRTEISAETGYSERIENPRPKSVEKVRSSIRSSVIREDEHQVLQFASLKAFGA